MLNVVLENVRQTAFRISIFSTFSTQRSPAEAVAFRSCNAGAWVFRPPNLAGSAQGTLPYIDGASSGALGALRLPFPIHVCMFDVMYVIERCT
jgi:hypothetical protein